MSAGRIAFLCGCAEPGRDGVGDYTAGLAAECARRGWEVLVIALCDRFVKGVREQTGLLRIGAGEGWARAREVAGRFGPDVVSLQWVPYAFHPRGMPWGIGRELARIAGRARVHVMCHEIWIGTEAGARPAHWLTGVAQRQVMRRLMRELRPARIHTSNAAYAGLLRRAGMETAVLPLFGAIPITGRREERRDGAMRMVMFGEIHPEWLPEPLLTLLTRLLRGLDAPIELMHVGRIGRGEEVWERMKRSGRITFKRLGEQPAAEVSQCLANSDYGIATTPLALVGKSGTAAAMLEHGLPVIVNRDDVRYPGIDPGAPPVGVIAMDGRFEETLRAAKRREACSRLAKVADQFLNELIQP